MSRLEGTERLGADHRQPRVSLLLFGPGPAESIGPMQGRRPGRLLSPGGRLGSRRRARALKRSRYPCGAESPAAPRAWRSGCQGGSPASSRPRVRRWASETCTLPRYPRREAADKGQRLGAGEQRRCCARRVPQGAARGRWKRRAAPPQPHPSRGCLPAWPLATGCGPSVRVKGDAAALPGPLHRRPGDLEDKSLQHAARLQCESHPPRRLLQHQRSQTNK